MFNFFKRKPVQQLFVAPTNSISKAVAAASQLRRRPTSKITEHQAPKRGMWVMRYGRIGILTNLEQGDVATVMLVDSIDGTNMLEIHCNASELRQAWYDEIPYSRRPDYGHAERLGYHAKLLP